MYSSRSSTGSSWLWLRRISLIATATIFVAVGLLGATPARAQAGSTQYCVNLPAVADTYIEQASPTTNRGTSSTFLTDSQTAALQRALLQFDLSIIPGPIQYAKLVLNQTANRGASSVVNVHQVTSQWTETGATWNNRQAGTPWTSAGGDYDAAVVGSFTANSVAERVVDISTLAEQWRTGAVTNFGVLLESAAAVNDNVKTYASDENGTIGIRPRLEICYTGAAPQAPPPLPGEYCYISSVGKPDVGAFQYWTDNNDGTITIRTVFAKTFVDNTYGVNAIGWPSGHTFGNLVGSDHVIVALYDNANVKKMEVKLDYITASAGAPSGYDALGVTGGEGSMILGSVSDVVSSTTSLDINFNTFGYVLTVDSPATDASYTPNPTYPNWIYEVWYEVTIKKAPFGTSGFGYPIITSIHASPSKTGSNTEPVTPSICVSKDFLSATKLPNGTWDILYNIDVRNNGAAAGQYDLSDQPTFDNDVAINNASFTSDVPSNGALTGSGPWVLGDNVGINARSRHVYTMSVNATLDLGAGSGGDNLYTRCESISIDDPRPGEGFFNEARLDRNNDGTIDQVAEDCGDIPDITHNKRFVSLTRTGGLSWRAVYEIEVINGGGVTGTYNLVDQPGFDADIVIDAASYTSTVSAGGALPGSGPWTLATDQTLPAGRSHVYRLTVDLTLGLSDGVTGDDNYDACESTTPGTPQAGEGLFNQSQLDINDDGIPDETSEVCDDVPAIAHEKQFISATQLGDGTWDVLYRIVVVNYSHVSGAYDLVDAPAFDDDIIINSASFTSTIPTGGPLAGSGPWMLADDQAITSLASHVYLLRVNATFDLSDGSSGDNDYVACETGTPGNPQGGEGLFNEARLDLNNDGVPDEVSEDCGDLPEITHIKQPVSTTQQPDLSWNVVYRITVSNNGGLPGFYDLVDEPDFAANFTINSASFVSTVPSGSALAGSGPWTLADDQNISVGASHVYTLTVNVDVALGAP